MATAPTPLHRRRTPDRVRIVELALLVVLVVAVVALAVRGGDSRSGLQGSGHAATQTRSLPPFRAVELAGGAAISVTTGATQRVVVHADDNLLDRVTTRVVSGRLVVGNDGSFSTNSPMRVEVAVPSLRALVLSGGGVVDATSLHEQALSVTLSGGGVLRASGAVERLRVLLSGGGDAQLGDLVARAATATLAGGGRIVVHATESLDARVTGAGAIVYLGAPKRLVTHVGGAGAITPGG